MRQDPDVMLLGEIRDEETAKIAIRSAITGHLVLSTLHTNDAVTAIPRLMDLNLDRFLVSSSLLAIVAQRLVRKICKFCKTEYNLNEHEQAIFEECGITLTTAMKGIGCPKCEGTGYVGRLAIGEVLTIDDEIREMIYGGVFVTAIKDAAVKKGMTSMKEDGIRKAAAGLTTLREVLRVAG
jgi:type II secretory ATPase GspE/PulE/Tfp pilus assembly ATPase PilB-like protein